MHDGPPRINKKQIRGLSEHFSSPDLAQDDCILKFTIDKIILRSSSGLISAFSLNGRVAKRLATIKCTHFIGKNLNIDSGLNFPYMTSIATTCHLCLENSYKNCVQNLWLNFAERHKRCQLFFLHI